MLIKIGKLPDAPSFTDSHDAPGPGAAVKASPSAPSIFRGCSAGAVAPTTYLKLSEAGEALIGAVVTAKVTLIICEVAPLAAIVMVPL
jgi:hypothetical protein